MHKKEIHCMDRIIEAFARRKEWSCGEYVLDFIVLPADRNDKNMTKWKVSH